VYDLAQAYYRSVRLSRRAGLVGMELPSTVVRVMEDVRNPRAAVENLTNCNDGDVGRIVEGPGFHRRRYGRW